MLAGGRAVRPRACRGSWSARSRCSSALTPAELQGRAYSAADLLLGAPQTASIAAGAALVAVVGYRWLLGAEAAVVAIAAAYLLTRGSGEEVLRGARELEDDGGLGVGRRRGGLGLGEDGPHAVEGLREH